MDWPRRTIKANVLAGRKRGINGAPQRTMRQWPAYSREEFEIEGEVAAATRNCATSNTITYLRILSRQKMPSWSRVKQGTGQTSSLNRSTTALFLVRVLCATHSPVTTTRVSSLEMSLPLH